MTQRNRLLQVITVLLYMGPLLAGLAGYGPLLLAPFVMTFMLWLIMLRPHIWPRSFAEWCEPASVLALITLALTQLLFVSLLFGVARGIGGVLGYLPLLHPLLPVALSLLALPALLLMWTPRMALAGDIRRDRPLRKMHGEAGNGLAEEGQKTGDRLIGRPIPVAADEAVSELFALAEVGDVREEDMLDALDRFCDTGDQWSRLAVLAAALDASPTTEHVALRTAVILKATDPIPQSEFTVPGEIRTAFDAAGNSAALLSLLALRGRALLHKIPAAAHYFPPQALVLELADSCEDVTAARALRDLAAELPRSDAEEQITAKPNVPVFIRTELRSFPGAQSA